MKKEARDSSDIEADLQDVTNILTSLNIKYERTSKELKEEIATLKQEISRTKDTIVPRTENNNLPSSLELGGSVRITNNYKSQYGTIGRIRRLNQTWVWIEDCQGRINQRARKNIETLRHDINKYNTLSDEPTKWYGRR